MIFNSVSGKNTLPLIKITDKIKEAIDNKKFASGVFTDLQKAFDTVNHEILLTKLEHYGIRGVANNWFCSYLQKRKQIVHLSNTSSNLADINFEIPQGSVLGPLLFLIYMNDLSQSTKHSTVFHFADDTNLLQINNSLK